MQSSLAILVTGEIRASAKLLDELNAGGLADRQVICSVWGLVGSKLGGWIGPRQICRVLGDAIGSAFPPSLIGFGHFERMLPAFFGAVRAELGSRPVDREMLRAITPYLDIEDQRLFVETLPERYRKYTARFIHYKFARALALLRIAEAEQEREYACVARIRPDLGALPQWPDECGAREIFVDWAHADDATGKLIAGDNVILARREVMIGLAEHMRDAIYERAEHNIHVIIGGFIEKAGLEPRTIQTSIADDPWPRETFLEALRDKAAAHPDDRISAAFLACVEANRAREEGDFAGARAILDRLGHSDCPSVQLALGRIALATGRERELDHAIEALRSAPNPSGLSDHDFYRERLESLRARARREARKAQAL